MRFNQHTPAIERFWYNTMPEPNTGCWIWTGKLDTGGYGRISPLGRSHRASFILFKGPIINGMHVLHSCDNTWCVNPDHLRLGSHHDNMRDKAIRGRAKAPIQYSEDIWSAKLNEKQAAQIKALYILFNVKQKDIAESYGVSVSTVSMIVNGKTWQRIKNR